MTIRYQEQPFYLRWLIWLRWMPFAWVRGIWWYISQLWVPGFSWDEKIYFKEGLHDCIDISIGDIQATKMHWVYSGEECMGARQSYPSPTEAIDSLHTTITTDAKDWSLNKRDAWVYGIVVGWDECSLSELRKKFKWSDKDVSRLIKYHDAICRVR